jgi:hypothetical protein
MYIASDDRWSSTTAAIGGAQRTVLEPLHKREIWLSVSDVCKPGLLRNPSVVPPMKLNDGVGLSCPNRGGWGDPTYRFLRSRPPAAAAEASAAELSNATSAGTTGRSPASMSGSPPIRRPWCLYSRSVYTKCMLRAMSVPLTLLACSSGSRATAMTLSATTTPTSAGGSHCRSARCMPPWAD